MNRRVSLACISVPLSETASSNGACSPSGSAVSGSVRRAPELVGEQSLVVEPAAEQDPGGDRVRVGGEGASRSTCGTPRSTIAYACLAATQRSNWEHRPSNHSWFGCHSHQCGHGVFTVRARSWSSLQGKAVTGQHPIDGRRRRPHPLLVGAAVSELAMGPVHVAPLVEQRQDLSLLPLQEPVDRVPARAGVIECAPGSALLPPPRPTPVQLERRRTPGSASSRHRTASSIKDSNATLAVPSTRAGTGPLIPSAIFPRSTANSTACSTTVAWSRSTSARNAAASDASWRD